VCELFALSSQLPTRVTFSLEEFSRHGASGGPLADGWGLAFYDGSDAQLFREPRPAASSEWMKFILSHAYYSNCVMSHIRNATEGRVALCNTQPFSRVLKGRRHVFCHNGNLNDIRSRFKLGQFLPIGETDSEYGFCRLMDRLAALWQGEVPTLDERINVISEVLIEFTSLGAANILFSDSEFLYAFAHQRTQDNGRIEAPGMYYQERHCDCDPDALQDSGVQIHNMAQDLVLFASVPLSKQGWHACTASQFIVVKEGKIILTRNLH